MKIKHFCLISLLGLLVGCGTPPVIKREPIAASPAVRKDLKQAQVLAKSGDSKKALVKLKKIASENPDSDVAGDAQLQMADLYYRNQKYIDALSTYDEVIRSPTGASLEAPARLGAARTLLRLGRLSEAEERLAGAKLDGLSLENKQSLLYLQFEIQQAGKKHLSAAESLADLSEVLPKQGDKDRIRNQAQEYLESHLSQVELETAAKNSRHGFLQSAAYYKLGLLAADQRDYARAKGLFAKAASAGQGSELGERAQRFVLQIDARDKVDPGTIGVVLPLSGKQARVGQKVLRALQLALGIYGKKPSRLRIAVVDSEGHPEVARRAIERLVQEDNVIAIVGGLLSRTAEAEAQRAQEFGVPIIVLTQKSGVTDIGENVFRNALTSQMLVQQLVDTAMGSLKYRNFAILYPNDAYGTEYANLFWDEVKSRGGNISGAQVYEPKETDFRGHIQRMTGLFYPEDRADEYKYRLKEFEAANPKRSKRLGAVSVEDILQPMVDFQALFVPDSVRAVGQIAPMLAYNSVKDVRLLGTNLWNSASLVTRGQKFVEDVVFVDSIGTNDAAFRDSEFFVDFKATYNEEPGMTELQAFDSASLLRQLIQGGESSRVGLQRAMETLKEFNGAAGKLTLNARREFKRSLSALTVKSGKITAFSAAE